MKIKAILLVLGVGAALTVASVSPSLGTAAGSETSVTAAAGGAFPKRVGFGSLKLERWTLGIGVVVQSDGSAVGDFVIGIEARSAGRDRYFSLEGIAEDGLVHADGSVTFSGTAIFKLDGSISTGYPFSVTATRTGYQLTLGGSQLEPVELGAGSVFIG